MKSKSHYELIIIGAGPGGYAAAFRASDLGKNVLLIDKNKELGGVCLNRGCIPSKALLHLAKVIEDSESVEHLGVKFTPPQIDFSKVQEWKESVIGKLNSGIMQMADLRGVKYTTGMARFISKNEIIVTESNTEINYSFDKCIIATGSRPSTIPNLPNDSRILSSTGLLNIEKVPGRLLIIGGGYIGLEMGSVFAAFNSQVSVVEFMPSLLPGADSDLVKPLHNKLNKTMEKIYLSTKVDKIIPDKKGLIVNFIKKDGTNFNELYDIVLVSVGRKPNTDKLNLEKIGIETNDRNFIIVNNQRQTSVPNIYAIGDVTGDPMLAHKATHEGKVAAELISGSKSASFSPKAIPAVIYTDPEIAWAGKTENELKESGISYNKGDFPWKASGRSIALDRFEGKTKILTHSKTGEILGVGIVGPNAGDLIGEAMLAIEMGADAEDIGLTIHPHPSLTETFSNAAEILDETITDLYIPKK